MKPHFNNSKYTRWYWNIIDRRIAEPASADSYREQHHIIPESFYINRTREGPPGWLEGDPNRHDNLVWLTAREHALCHWLLTKMTGERELAYKLMVYSFNMMWVGGEHQERTMTRMITRAYERNRTEWSRIHSETMKGQFKSGRVIWNKGRKEDRPDVLENIQKAARNRDPLTAVELEKSVAKRVESMKRNGTDKRSDETRKRMSESMTGLVRGPQTDEQRRNTSLALTGKKKPSGHGDNVAAANRGRKIINKDGREKRVTKDKLQKYLDEGWRLGRPNYFVIE
jgi:hypothetical protein